MSLMGVFKKFGRRTAGKSAPGFEICRRRHTGEAVSLSYSDMRSHTLMVGANDSGIYEAKLSMAARAMLQGLGMIWVGDWNGLNRRIENVCDLAMTWGRGGDVVEYDLMLDRFDPAELFDLLDRSQIILIKLPIGIDASEEHFLRSKFDGFLGAIMEAQEQIISEMLEQPLSSDYPPCLMILDNAKTYFSQTARFAQARAVGFAIVLSDRDADPFWLLAWVAGSCHHLFVFKLSAAGQAEFIRLRHDRVLKALPIGDLGRLRLGEAWMVRQGLRGDVVPVDFSQSLR